MVLIHEGERVDHLYSADLSIIQSSEVFSFSLDALLLAHFAQIPSRARLSIIDLCAGNGAVTLLVASQTKSKVVGIELQERLVDMAKRSVQLNGLTDQIDIIQYDVRHLDQLFCSDSVDIITCNPPYFDLGAENKISSNTHKAIARHEQYLQMNEFIPQIGKVLKVGGRAYLVHRPERFLELIDLMREYRLTPKKLQFVYPKRDRAAKMLLIEGIKDGKMTGLKLLPPVFVHGDDGKYLPEVSRLIYGKS